MRSICPSVLRWDSSLRSERREILLPPSGEVSAKPTIGDFVILSVAKYPTEKVSNKNFYNETCGRIENFRFVRFTLLKKSVTIYKSD